MIANITIAHVPNDAIKIAAILRCYSIMQPNKICIMPEFNGKQQFFKAYINVSNWSDTISSQNLQARIKDPCKEARLVYQDDNWWAIEETEKEDMKFTESDAFKKWTTMFSLEEQEEEEQVKDQDQVQVQVQVEA